MGFFKVSGGKIDASDARFIGVIEISTLGWNKSHSEGNCISILAVEIQLRFTQRKTLMLQTCTLLVNRPVLSVSIWGMLQGIGLQSEYSLMKLTRKKPKLLWLLVNTFKFWYQGIRKKCFWCLWVKNVLAFTTRSSQLVPSPTHLSLPSQNHSWLVISLAQ